jgi:hypothetical protein
LELERIDSANVMALNTNSWVFDKFYATICQTFCIICSLLNRFYHDRRVEMQRLGGALRNMAWKYFGIEFVDIFHIPLHRRLQTLAVLQWGVTFLYLGLACLVIFILLLFTPLFFVPLAYAAWFIYDFRTPEQGGRRWEWVRNWKIWSYYRDYFPAAIHSTATLDPMKNYLLVYHPHGILVHGAFINFGTNATSFSRKFPGIRPTLLSLQYQFLFPFNREYAMALGVCPCSRRSIDWLFTQQGKGNAVVLVVGGAMEALEARPGSFTLTVKNRKGFARVALQHGTPLVPVFAFGENDLYNQVPNPPGSLLRRFQMKMTRLLTFSPPAFYGRGVFNYTLGFLPYRRPLNVVVGSPMAVDQVTNPTEEQIDDVHRRYIEHLTAFFEAQKTTYGIAPEQHLNII